MSCGAYGNRAGSKSISSGAQSCKIGRDYLQRAHWLQRQNTQKRLPMVRHVDWLSCLDCVCVCPLSLSLSTKVRVTYRTMCRSTRRWLEYSTPASLIWEKRFECLRVRAVIESLFEFVVCVCVCVCVCAHLVAWPAVWRAEIGPCAQPAQKSLHTGKEACGVCHCCPTGITCRAGEVLGWSGQCQGRYCVFHCGHVWHLHLCYVWARYSTS